MVRLLQHLETSPKAASRLDRLEQHLRLKPEWVDGGDHPPATEPQILTAQCKL